MVCASSNAAVDLLTEKIAEQELSVIRIGNISRVDEDIIKHTLEAQLAAHPESKNIKKVKIQAANARKKAGKFKRKFGGKERMERRDLYTEARELTAWANQLEDRLIDQILDNDGNPATNGFSQEFLAPSYGYYWSSTEFTNSSAWFYTFISGSLTNGGKSNFYSVRAVRAF